MFLNETMLAGIAGAFVPLLLHLLNRARYRTVDWGAMLFLGTQDPQQNRGSKLKEMTLLGMRMLIVALLAIALARPVLRAAGAPQQDAPARVVIIFDRSASMGLEETGLQRIETARRAALGVLGNLRSGDEAAVIYTPEVLGLAAPEVTSDLQSLGYGLGNVRPGAGRADIAAAMTTAAGLLQAPDLIRRQLVIIDDRQLVSWRDVNDSFIRNFRQSIADNTGQTPQIAIVPIGNGPAGNVAIDSIQVLNTPVIRGASTELEVRVRSYDTIPAVALPLSIWVDNQEIHHTVLNVPPGATVTTRFATRFSSAGSKVLTARIGSHGVPADDNLDYALQVTDAIDVLIISPEERSAGRSSMGHERDFLGLALAPFRSASQIGPDPARVQVVQSDAWPQLDRSRQRVVILANVPRLSALQARQLEQFVFGGGGLLVAPGNLSRIEDYNTFLWRNGAGVLPTALDPPTAADGSQATALLGLELSHPAFRFLQGRQDPLPKVTIGRYFPLRSTEPRGRVIGQYENAQPFAIEGSYGRGRVLLLTTALDADWNNLPFSNFYLPFVQSAVRFLASGLVQDRNLVPGEPIEMELENIADPVIRMDMPGRNNLPIEAVRTAEGYEARFTNTVRTGIYTLRVSSAGSPTSEPYHFVVRPLRDEADLATLPAQRSSALQHALNYSSVGSDNASIAGSLAWLHQRHELWPILLPLVIALTLCEMGLSRVWTAPVPGGRR